MLFSGRISTLRFIISHGPRTWGKATVSRHALQTGVQNISPRAAGLSAAFCHANLFPRARAHEPTPKVIHKPLKTSPTNARCSTFLLLYALFLTLSNTHAGARRSDPVAPRAGKSEQTAVRQRFAILRIIFTWSESIFNLLSSPTLPGRIKDSERLSFRDTIKTHLPLSWDLNNNNNNI